MSAYRPLGTFPQYFLADGTVNNGGLINFYETDLTTRKDTYSDDGMTTPNANPVVLDSAGRPTSDIWGDGAYGVVITDSLGANPRTLNNIQPDSGAGLTIPSLVTDEFLTNNGSVLQWSAIRQLADPTGFAGDVMTTDGTLTFWAPIPAAAVPDITVTANSFQAGISTNTSKFLVQMGTATAPASGTPDTGVNVTFPTAFTTCLHVGMTIDSTHTSQIIVPYMTQPATTTGFSGTFSDAVQHNIVNDVIFTWVAFGFITE